jgi:hypothetical protein
MTTENAATTDTAAAVAEQGATVAPKKAANSKKGVPTRQKIAKGGKAKAPRTTAKPKKAIPARKGARAPKKAPKPKAAGVREGSKTVRSLRWVVTSDSGTAETSGGSIPAELG